MASSSSSIREKRPAPEDEETDEDAPPVIRAKLDRSGPDASAFEADNQIKQDARLAKEAKMEKAFRARWEILKEKIVPFELSVVELSDKDFFAVETDLFGREQWDNGAAAFAPASMAIFRPREKPRNVHGMTVPASAWLTETYDVARGWERNPGWDGPFKVFVEANSASMHPYMLPCICVVSDDDPETAELLWTHRRARGLGLEQAMADALGIKTAKRCSAAIQAV